ncbi:MAG: hypothetical protein GY769_07870 [bacterium]|nr:hypothetical protein [bacterium]
MRFVGASGRVFETTLDDFVFTKEPPITLPGLVEYRIDGKAVDLATFEREMDEELEVRVQELETKRDLLIGIALLAAAATCGIGLGACLAGRLGLL